MNTIEEISALLQEKNIAIKYLPKDNVEVREEQMLAILKEKMDHLTKQREEYFDLAEGMLRELKTMDSRKEELDYTLKHIKEDIEQINNKIRQVKGYVLHFGRQAQ